jgi:hypothetical protein
LEARRRKAAAVVTAVARVLESDRPIGPPGQRAVDAFRQFETFSAQTRSWLTGEPYAYFWGRLAYELLASVLRPDSGMAELAGYYCRNSGIDARAALVRHLEDFKRLLIAATFLEEGDMDLVEPLTIDAPFALPGTNLSISGKGRAVIFGIDGGKLRSNNGNEIPCQVVEYAGCRIRLQPAVFNVLASGIPNDTWQADHDFQIRHASRIEEALRILYSLGEGMLDQIRDGIRVIGLRPAGREGELTNISHCDLPGAISISPVPHPYELANIIWHEFLHNRLFALEEKGRFLGPTPANADDGVYSPWRRDYRPAHGLLHAVYVFTGLGRYWLAVLGAADTPPAVCELAATRILKGLYQVRLGIALLRRRAQLTERGDRLMDSLEQEHESLWRTASDAGLRLDLPHMTFRHGTAFGTEAHDETVRERVRAHLHRYAHAEDSKFLEPLLAR